MSAERDKGLDLEKAKVVDRLEEIERFMRTQGEVQRKLVLKMYGDYENEPPVKGHEQRLMRLEYAEDGRDKAKRELLKLAVGSFTIAVGGIIVWIFGAIKAAFIKGH